MDGAFPGPGLAALGLGNLGDGIGVQFLEGVVPTALTAPAARYLSRSGDGGYMANFKTGDLAFARARVDALKIRRVWNIDLPDISASHLHPGDVGAAIVSIDEARPAASWRWGGPGWETRASAGKLIRAVMNSDVPDRPGGPRGAGVGVGG